jgi:outer membrane lipoprotein-sorting protein
MNNKIFALLIIVCLVTISGCQVDKITPQNVDPIAKEIQSQYDGISAYEARIYQIRSDDSIKAGRFAAKKPDQIFELVYWEGETFLSRVEVCNGQKDEVYTAESGVINTIDTNCKNRVDSHFEVFDRIKKLASYENSVREMEIKHSNNDYKDVSFFSSSSSYDKDQFKILKTSNSGYSVAEKTTSGSGDMENQAGVEITFTDDTNHKIRLIFLKNNYQLIKSEIISQSGAKETVYYSDLQFDNEVNLNYFKMPSMDDINALK